MESRASELKLLNGPRPLPPEPRAVVQVFAPWSASSDLEIVRQTFPREAID
jgi:hypothetical protein